MSPIMLMGWGWSTVVLPTLMRFDAIVWDINRVELISVGITLTFYVCMMHLFHGHNDPINGGHPTRITR